MVQLMSVPEVAAGASEVLLAEWSVATGAEVSRGDVIAVAETDKAVVEVEAEFDGVVVGLLAQVGERVDVGAPLMLVGTGADLDRELAALLAEVGVSAPAAEPAAPAEPVVEPAAESARRFASPLARRLIEEAGLDLADITGTGPRGRVRKRDVERALADRAPAPAPAPAATTTSAPAPVPAPAETAPEPGLSIEPHSRLRRSVAARLTQAKQEIPHFYLTRSARIDDLLALRAQVNEHAPVRVSVNDLVLRAVAVAHRAVPEANVVWSEEGMVQHTSVDVAVAVASERGLVTPVVRGVDQLSLSGLARQVGDYVGQANAGRLQQRDLEGGTITVTNLGMYGVEEFSAIINPPHSAILAVGAARPEPVVEGEPGEQRIEIRTVLRLVLSVDHRAIDGALAARWMASLVEALERPMTLLV
ncbi:dihydrolipoamide acetyltransferase family protein [Pimelobacter simplex]|uniref:dihydrolipoamide acetyltransferase family protein n=1 Tax=Nocardioides simplex TaxID=2045 RepID=UPI00366A7AE0